MQTRSLPAHRSEAANVGAISSIAPAHSTATCPRCREVLAILRPECRHARGITARLCPSLSCGYKLIVPM